MNYVLVPLFDQIAFIKLILRIRVGVITSRYFQSFQFLDVLAVREQDLEVSCGSLVSSFINLP